MTTKYPGRQQEYAQSSALQKSFENWRFRESTTGANKATREDNSCGVKPIGTTNTKTNVTKLVEFSVRLANGSTSRFQVLTTICQISYHVAKIKCVYQAVER